MDATLFNFFHEVDAVTIKPAHRTSLDLFFFNKYNQNKRTIFNTIGSGPYFELRREEIRFVHGTQTLTRVERLEKTEYKCGHKPPKIQKARFLTIFR